ncbi:UNVERIFIED_CONTAM: 1-aminocyclopropane-1-carboxylate synthase [Sesamum angustifolium]|uniref:1-aminocyclopropane-1-carboxylate synthase n=1 Tax=Sesamum angustifolium TaxID=2727405 RepID=A0AAW2RGH2_9LAMI
MGLWKVIISDVKLNVSPGSSFHCHEPGWFRVCIANMDDETVEVHLENPIVCREIQRSGGSSEEVMAKKPKVELSYTNVRRKKTWLVASYDVSLSPIPQSPLVRART